LESDNISIFDTYKNGLNCTTGGDNLGTNLVYTREYCSQLINDYIKSTKNPTKSGLLKYNKYVYTKILKSYRDMLDLFLDVPKLKNTREYCSQLINDYIKSTKNPTRMGLKKLHSGPYTNINKNYKDLLNMIPSQRGKKN
jgi:ribosomal protein L30/L7E